MKRDGRLLFVFRLCLELGIDDPAEWMNRVPPALIDQWRAYFEVKHEHENRDKQQHDPSDVHMMLEQAHAS